MYTGNSAGTRHCCIAVHTSDFVCGYPKDPTFRTGHVHVKSSVSRMLPPVTRILPCLPNLLVLPVMSVADLWALVAALHVCGAQLGAAPLRTEGAEIVRHADDVPGPVNLAVKGEGRAEGSLTHELSLHFPPNRLLGGQVGHIADDEQSCAVKDVKPSATRLRVCEVPSFYSKKKIEYLFKFAPVGADFDNRIHAKAKQR